MSFRKGFTLIETLVVVGVLTLMTSLLVLYNRTGERQIILLREKARLIGTIFRAKSLTLNTFIEDEPACGYGVHTSQGEYFIYRDKAIACRTSDHVYTDTTDEIVAGTLVRLDAGLRFGGGTVTDMVFVPPDPKVFLNGRQGFTEGEIILEGVDGKSSVTIQVNNAGQISAE